MKKTLFLLAFLTALIVNAQSPFPSGIRLPNATKSDTISDDTRIPIMQHDSGNLINKYVPVSDIVGSLSGFVPTTRTITINGVAQDLSANRSWSVGDVLTSGSYSNPSWITGLAYSKITGVPDFLRADIADDKTSGSLQFFDDVEAEFGQLNPMSISANSTINTINLSTRDLQMISGGTQRFLFARATGNFTNTGTITSQGTGNSSFAGNVGIGVTPNTKLTILGDGAAIPFNLVGNSTANNSITGIDFTVSTAIPSVIKASIVATRTNASGSGDITLDYNVHSSSSGEIRALRMWYNGNISIGNTNNTYKLDVSGTGRFTSTVTATDFILSSDRRLKKNIKDYKPKPIKWDLKNYVLKSDESNKETIGVIAQQLEKHHPEFVETNAEGMKGVNYTKLLLAKVAELEKRIIELEKNRL